MYRAIICDDEETVRNGLKKHFDWSGHKIEIVGIFEDGIPAFEYMKTHDVDIIITDVRMIHMDGITLAQKASVLYPEVKVLFISGYADIEYLKEADIVVTNPPFSLFREYVAQLMEYDKKFRFFCKCWGRRKQRSFGKNQMRTAF